MDEIRRQDLKAFGKELLNGPRLFAALIGALVMLTIASMASPFQTDRTLEVAVSTLVAFLITHQGGGSALPRAGHARDVLRPALAAGRDAHPALGSAGIAYRSASTWAKLGYQ